MNIAEFRHQFRAQANPQQAAVQQGFFKTGPGQYGEGDQFLGLKVPQTRAFLPKTDGFSETDILSLLHSAWHEERLLALFVWIRRFERAKRDLAARQEIVDLYLKNTPWINNWDLVDTSAPPILGVWLLDHDRAVLRTLAQSRSLWEQRISVLATLTLIRKGQFAETIELCERFLTHPHDLMHKACGWMLRELGKRDVTVLRSFLNAHAAHMPRTMLRYAIEKLAEPERKLYLQRPR